MKRAFLDALRCPHCGSRSLALTVTAEDAREVRDGTVACAGCNVGFPIVRGVLETLDPLKPATLRGTDHPEFLYLLMPVRIS